MGKMQEEIKALRRQNTHLQNVVQRQRERLAEADEAIKAFSDMADAHYAACAVRFGEKREDCGVLWGYHNAGIAGIQHDGRADSALWQ